VPVKKACPWDGLHHAAITGESGFNKVFGQPLFDYLGTHADLAPIFDAGMTAIHGHETTAMLEAYDFSAVDVLADIGGGNGSLIGAVLQRYPKLRGLLFELDHREDSFPVGTTASTIKSFPFFGITFRQLFRIWTDCSSVQS
jgi:hypothetical protein